jgi:hypothetical protein
VQRRAAQPAELAVARFKWPWESDEKVAVPAQSGATDVAAKAAGEVAEKAKKEAAEKRAALEKEIAGMDSADGVLLLSVGSTISAAQPALARPVRERRR